MWDCDKNTERKCFKLAIRDFIFLAVLFILIAIFMLSMTVGGNIEANNRLSFASTLTSIVLSVIAILMTILSEYKNERTKASIEKTIDVFQTLGNDVNSRAEKQVVQLRRLNRELNIRFFEISNKLDLINNNISLIVSTDSGDGWVNSGGDRNEQ